MESLTKKMLSKTKPRFSPTLGLGLLLILTANLPLALGAPKAKAPCSPLYEGVFVRATTLQHDALGTTFRQAGIIKKLEGEISRVEAKDLAVDFNTMSQPQMKALVEEGRKSLSELYYFTSGAGLWSRGGGQIKALIPFNIKALLSEKDYAMLVESGDIASASNPADVLKFAHRELKAGEDATAVADVLVKERRAVLTQLIAKARSHPDSLNPIDMKLATVALQSKQAKTYIPFDIWTSEQTHQSIKEYLLEFEKKFAHKKFHPDPKTDQEIKKALGEYIHESQARNETHLFGYQVGYHALNPDTAKAVTDTAAIGEGAGMARAYLGESGRAAQLAQAGKKTWVFENIEVLTDLSAGMGAHTRARTPVSVILVPEKKGYKGGSPFLIKKNGRTNLELHEMSVLPAEYAQGNQYFNSNTIFQSLELAPPKNIGFEVKSSGTGKIVRAKVNAGDITQEAPTSGIGGRIGVEYENFKNYVEFGENGQSLIDTWQGLWARDAGH